MGALRSDDLGSTARWNTARLASGGLKGRGHLLLFSFSLGLVAAFNPCGFPLLPAYLMLSAGEAGSKPVAARIGRSLTAGLGMTVGFILVFGALGLAFDLGVAVSEIWVPWVMILVGAVCAAYGIATCFGRNRGLRLPLPRVPRDRSTALTFSVFGVGFAVASLSCAQPLFVAGVAAVFGRHGTGDGLASGLAYAVGMGLVVTCVSLAGAGARQVRLSRIRSVEPFLTRLAGAVLAVAGAYLVLYWLNDLVSPLHTPAAERLVERLQVDIDAFLVASPRLTGLVVGVVVIAALTVAAIYAARAEHRIDTPGTSVTQGPAVPDGWTR
jgi:cytochrome c biogenesis protein CcdA